MNNFIYSALLILVKALHLADADCTVPDIANAYLNRDDQCKDITITCQRGYKMQSVLSCSKGLWIFEEPICAPDFTDQCLGEPEITNGILDDAITSRNFGDIYGFKCDSPFVENGNKGRVTCTETGKWETNITCEEVQCPAGERFDYTDEETPLGILTQSYKLNCSIGATHIGSSLIVQCSTDGNKGRWEVIHYCEPVQCPARQSNYMTGGKIPDGIYDDRYQLWCANSEIPFDYGYSPITCMADGQWFEENVCYGCLSRNQRYNFRYEVSDKSLESCDDSCQVDGNCTDFAQITFGISDPSCYLLFESKVIYFDQLNQERCIEECKSKSECVALNHWEIGDVCVLFNQTDGIPSVTVSDDDAILKKGFCPFLL